MHILFCYSMSYFGKLSVCFIIRMHLLSIFPYLQDVHQLLQPVRGFETFRVQGTQ